MNNSVKERVFEIICDIMEVPREKVDIDSSFETIESWDSINQMNLVLALEEEFEMQFTDEQIVGFTNAHFIIEVLKEDA